MSILKKNKKFSLEVICINWLVKLTIVLMLNKQGEKRYVQLYL